MYIAKSLIFTCLASSAAAAPLLSATSASYWTATAERPFNQRLFKRAEGTFAVLRFNQLPGKFSAEGRIDPIVSPGTNSSHSHGIMGGNAFDLTIDGDQLLSSSCTNSKVTNDKSNYWVPQIWFHSPETGKFKQVPLYYMNVYYFFDPTNDEIMPFPPGLKIVSGDAMKRTPPSSGTGALQLDPSKGEIQAIQWTCPASGDPDRYPVGSDGSTAGIADPVNKGAGAGFPSINCDGLYSPLRQDIHMPSCYNPEVGLDDYMNNMAFPTTGQDGMQDCPPGWVHVPHMFYEVYYDTQQFADQWTPNGRDQPFVLANGDRTGFSSHADFVAGWDEEALKTIIDTCNAEHAGMENCPILPGGVNTDTCGIESAYPNPTDEWLDQLPGDNPLHGWGY
ncbi:hypothetical protein DL766_002345 [Monosporascus sp. MC13-8B]|nr:hypothetical protein DL766_002345 [Monosporascus sp. MC13-8B]